MSATSTAGPLIFPSALTNGMGLAPKVMQPIPASTSSFTIGMISHRITRQCIQAEQRQQRQTAEALLHYYGVS
jgi:hypothetical protein